MMISETTTKMHDEPMIVKYVEKSRTGIEMLHLSRFAIGCLMRGEMYLYDGDKRRQIQRGELFFLGIGRHYVEYVPDDTLPFEMILFYYTSQDLQRVLMHLTVTYGLEITNNHSCERCRKQSCVVVEPGAALFGFFQATNSYLKEASLVHNETAESLKMTELVYLIVSQRDGCMKSRLLGSADKDHGSFEQVIYSHIFQSISIEELAMKTNRSLTSFKKEFRRHFHEPPHKWFVNQRLNHARLQLIATTKSISEIGNECSFPNTSHFIKLFKRAYHLTPVAYRQRHLQHRAAVSAEEKKGAYAEAQ